MNRFSISAVAAVALSGVLAIPAAQAAEVTLKGISGWPKSFPMVAKDFLPFIDEANKRGKGHFKIKWTGGAELGKPPAQAKGFKSGVYDVMYTAASYLRSHFEQGRDKVPVKVKGQDQAVHANVRRLVRIHRSRVSPDSQMSNLNPNNGATQSSHVSSANKVAPSTFVDSNTIRDVEAQPQMVPEGARAASMLEDLDGILESLDETPRNGATQSTDVSSANQVAL